MKRFTKLVINGKEFTLEEAQELYSELDKLFGVKDMFPPLVPQPIMQPSFDDPWRKIICGNDLSVVMKW